MTQKAHDQEQVEPPKPHPFHYTATGAGEVFGGGIRVCVPYMQQETTATHPRTGTNIQARQSPQEGRAVRNTKEYPLAKISSRETFVECSLRLAIFSKMRFCVTTPTSLSVVQSTLDNHPREVERGGLLRGCTVRLNRSMTGDCVAAHWPRLLSPALPTPHPSRR